MAEAYRLYLVHHLTGDHCADGHLIYNGPATIQLGSGQPTEVLGWSASVFFEEKILMPPLKPLSEQETTPHSLEGFAAGVNTCQDSQCQEINGLARDLAFSPEGQPLLQAEHDTDKWRAGLQATLTALDAWQPGNGQADEVFREKTWLYNNLFGMTAGASRENVLRSWLNYLKQSRATVSDRAQWFLPVNAVIGPRGAGPGQQEADLTAAAAGRSGDRPLCPDRAPGAPHAGEDSAVAVAVGAVEKSHRRHGASAFGDRPRRPVLRTAAANRPIVGSLDHHEHSRNDQGQMDQLVDFMYGATKQSGRTTREFISQATNR